MRRRSEKPFSASIGHSRTRRTLYKHTDDGSVVVALHWDVNAAERTLVRIAPAWSLEEILGGLTDSVGDLAVPAHRVQVGTLGIPRYVQQGSHRVGLRGVPAVGTYVTHGPLVAAADIAAAAVVGAADGVVGGGIRW